MVIGIIACQAESSPMIANIFPSPLLRNYQRKTRAMTKAEEAALKAYPKEEGKVYSTAFGTFEFDRNAAERKGFQKGYKHAENDIISLIESRIGEILGDAQPKPALRAELRELINKIEEKWVK